MTHEPESTYYEDRTMAIIYFFVNGILLSLVGFAILNAIQHPEIKESVINITGYLVPTVIAFILDTQVFSCILPTYCLVVALIILVLISLVNLLKMCNKTPICC